MENNFQETQRLSSWWIIALLSILAVIAISLLVDGIWSVRYNNEGFRIENLFMPLLILGLCGFILSIKLVTRITARGITVVFFPFLTEFHPWGKIEKVEKAKRKSINKGIRWSSKFGMTYSIKGDDGILIVHKTGERFFVGSGNPDEFLNEAKKYL